jgi:O-antigen ligase
MKQFITWVLAGVLCGTVLAFGGVETGATTAAEIAVFTAFFVLLFRQTKAGTVQLPVPVWPLLFFLWAGFAVVPLPPALVRTLSPHRWVDLAGVAADAATKWTTLSVYPHDTQGALLNFAAYLAIFVLAAWLHDSTSHRNAVLNVLVGLACFEAAYGMIQYLAGWQTIFGYSKVVDLYEATGTYINRDHFAGFLEMVIPFVFAMAFYQFQAWLAEGSRHAGWPHPARTSGAGARTILFLFLLAMLMLAEIFSRSRGGILVAAFSLIFVALLTQAKTGHKLWTLAVLFLFMGVLAYGLWIGLTPVLMRFEMMRETARFQLEVRPSIWADTLRLIHDYPVFGTGLGTFGVAFKPYQTAFVSFFVDHAHNEYLETAAETGWAGAGLLYVPMIVLLVRMVFSFLDDPRHYRRAVTLGSVGSTLAVLIHSLIDFNLHIPANALIFAFVLGIGYKASCLERRGERKKSPSFVA